MSFLSALNGLGLEQGIFVELKIPNLFEKIFSAIGNIYRSCAGFLKKLSIVRTFEIPENWTYQVDHEKGIEILEVERDYMAVEKTRNALRDIFQ